MGSRKSQILFLVVTVFVLLVTVVLLSTFTNNKTPLSEPTKSDESQARGKSLIFDRKNKLLSDPNLSPDTTLLLEEIRTKLGTEEEIHLSIDSELQDYLYGALEDIALSKTYQGGAGVIMDIKTGELLVLTSYSPDKSVVNKATNELFVPGSIIKPFIAMAALSEDLIDPNKEILSTGAITLTDNKGKKLLFNDWKAHGYVDMIEAIGVSSNVYFYAVGGGYQDQSGLGIRKIIEYLQLFGIGEKTGLDIISEAAGQLPSPEWKEAEFNGNKWRLGDTYLASIGQHGYQVTPIQMTRAVAAIATEGKMITPRIFHDTTNKTNNFSLPLQKEHFEIVKAGMEYAVINGTASGLYLDNVSLAAKTGTAEADSEKKNIHSWIIGYFPSEQPKYAFTLLLETGPWGEETGATAVAEQMFKWIRSNRPDYLSTN